MACIAFEHIGLSSFARKTEFLMEFSLLHTVSRYHSPFFIHFAANTGLYAHYVFKTLDSDRSGIVSFEVSESHAVSRRRHSSHVRPLSNHVKLETMSST